MTELLAALTRAGVEVLYSSELVPPQLTIDSEPRATDVAAQVAEVLAAHGLALQQVAPRHFVITRAPLAAPAASQPRPAPARLEEVSIYGSRYAFDRHGFAVPSELSRRYIAEAPGARNDVLRAAQTLPGIATGASARPYIRGSLPEDVLVIFDNVPIIDPFHLKKFQRLISVFDSSVIDRMDVYSGGYPVRFGTRSGGVIELTPRSLASGHENGIDVSLQNAAVSSVGHADGSAVDWLAALRGNVIDLLRRPVGSGSRQSNLVDFVGRVRWQPSDASAWVIGSLLMNDQIRLQNVAGDELATTHSRDEHTWLSYEWQPAGSWRSRTTLSLAREEQVNNGEIERPSAIVGTLLESRDFLTTSLNSEWTYEREGSGRWNLGAEAVDMHGDNIYTRSLKYSPALASSFGRAVDDALDQQVNPRQTSEAVFAAYRPQLAVRLEAEFGLRLDAQQVSRQTSQEQWSPRLNLRYHLSGQLDVYGSWGEFTQAQRPDEWRLEEGQVTADRAETVTQGIIGLSRNIADTSQWRIELYDKRWHSVSPYFDNLLDSQNLLANIFPDRVRVAPRSSGALGAEFSMRHTLRPHLELWASLTLAQVTDTFDDGSRVERSWDQRWSANTGLAWTGEHFSLLGMLRSHAGWPRTPVISFTRVAMDDAALQLQSRNTGRWDSFVSADLRAAWSRPLRSGSLELWAELTNAGNRDNKCCLRLASTLGLSSSASTISWQPRSIDIGVSWRMR